MNIVGCNKGLRAGRAVSAVVAWALLLTSCIKEDAGSCGSVGGPDGAVTVGFRSGTFAIAGPSGADDGWGTSATGAGSAAGASTRAGVPPTGMVEGAFQIGDLWVDGNRGRSVEKPMTWAEATQYCADLGLRLPTHDEMESIISYVRSNSPLPDNRKFEYYLSNGTRHNYYWTSTPRSADASYVWGAFLHLGRLGLEGLNAAEDDVSARCVKREGEEILPPAPDPGPDVEHPDGLPVGTTFRVVVYEAGADPQSDSPVDQNTYKIADAKGTIVASAVDEFGNATDDASRELVLRRGAYDFYYFSPAVPASTSMPNPGRYTDLTNGADYMALAQREVIDPSQGPKHYIPEVCFYRMGSYIDVRISPRAGEIMRTLEVTGDGLQLWGLPGSGRYEIGDYPYRLITEGSGGMVEFSPGAFAAVEGATATVSTVDCGGGLAVLPGYARDLQVKVTLTSDGKELKLDASLAGHNFAPGYRYVVELGVGRLADKPELDIEILPWNEYDWGDGFIGDRLSVDGAEVTPAGDIPAEGKTFSLTLTGNLPAAGVDVRAQSGGTALVSGTVTKSGTAVELAVPANAGYSSRSVTFEYLWRNTWTQIGDSRSQAGYSVSDATHTAPATIPGPGATYSVTLTGVLPADGVEVRAQSGGTALVTGKVTASGTAVSLTVPANATGADRTVTFEYLWNGTWTKIGDARTQQGYNVSNATHNAPATIPGQGGSYSVTLTGVLPSAGVDVRAQSGGTALVTGKVTASGAAVSLAVPANASYSSRTVTFEYQWNGTWTKIGSDCTQQGWNVTNASVMPGGAYIQGAGGTYTVTLTGWGGYKIRAISGSTELVVKNDYDDVPNYSASVVIPANPSYTATRSVTFQYQFNGTWKDITTRTQMKNVKTAEQLTLAACRNLCANRGGVPSWEQARVMDWFGWEQSWYLTSSTKAEDTDYVRGFQPSAPDNSTYRYGGEEAKGRCRCLNDE